jgi:hypothetical protein
MRRSWRDACGSWRVIEGSATRGEPGRSSSVARETEGRNSFHHATAVAQAFERAVGCCCPVEDLKREHRQGPDRRRHSRGGRRPEDHDGFAPLVLVADEDPDSRAICEAILAKLRFAVAPVDSVEKAVTVIGTLRPDVIVVNARETEALQRAAWPSGVPFVRVTDNIREPDALIEAIRKAIRNNSPFA